MRTSPWMCSGPTAVATNCTMNKPNISCASRVDIDRLISTAHGEGRLRRGEEQLLALVGVDRQAVLATPTRIANAIGSVPTSSVHWLTLDDTSVPRRVVGVEPHGVEAGHEQLGRLGRQRRQPLHEEELAHAERPARADERLGEVFGAQQDHPGGEDEQPDHRRRAGWRTEKVPNHMAGPTRWGSSAGAREMRTV